MLSVLEILAKTEEFFAHKGVPNPKIDAQYIVSHALGCKRLELFLRFDEPLDEAKLSAIRELVRRRGKREPLQHILGQVDFFGAKLKSDKRALVPRPETEELCEILTEKFFADPSAPIEILDLGTGTGAIAIALSLHFPNSKAVAVDASADALSLASENAEANRAKIDFIKSDWFESVSGKFDLIVSNPPYLTQAEVDSAQPEVKFFDPISALVSPQDGMADLEEILNNAKSHLKENGILALECGLGQPEKLTTDPQRYGFTRAEAIKDASKRVRFAIFQ